MTSPHIRLEVGGPVAHLILDRPDRRNALDLEMWQSIPPKVAAAEEDSDVKIVIVRGVDRTAFAAGADISQFHECFRNGDSARTYVDAVHDAEDALSKCLKPVIAMIHGDCVGGGVEIAIACDLRFCSADSRFGITPAKLGICYSMASTRRVSQSIGPSRTKDLLFTGRLINAETAQEWGLVDRVCGSDNLERETDIFVEQVCRNSQYSVRYAKKAMHNIMAGGTEEPANLLALRLGAYEAGDLKEGITAFREKRRPQFSWNA